MKATRIYAIFLRQAYLVRDNPTRFFQIFIWSTVDIALWGFLSKYLSDATYSALDFIPLLLGAVLLWDYLVQVMQGMTMSFFEDSWSHNFLNIFASPIKIGEYIAGLGFSGIARSILVFALIIILATFAFGFSVLAYGVSIFFFLSILLLFGIALGILGIGIVLRYGPSAEWFVWPIPAILSPFAGVFYPLSTLPQWMQYIGNILPPSYVFIGIRTILEGGTLPGGTLVFGAVLSIFYILLAYQFFTLMYHKVLRTGLIVRHSAENLN